MIEKEVYTEGTYEALHSRVEDLESQLRLAGLRVSASSRLANYRRLLARADAPSAGSPVSDNLVFHRAILECTQLRLIVSELSRAPEVAGWSAKMQTVLSGHDLPHTETRKSHARDLQFELYLAGLAKRAGYDVQLEEPDVVIRNNAGRAGLAAKRLKSSRRLRKNLRRASKQLSRAGVDGMVALDLSMLLLQTEKPLLVEDFSCAKAVYSSRLSEFLHSRAPMIRNSVDWNSAYGLVAMVSGCVWFSCLR